MTIALDPLPLAVLTRTEARCRRSSCGAPIVPVGMMLSSGGPVGRFSGEWRKDDGVWRITAYAKIVRKRKSEGVGSAVRRQRWTNPAAWKPVLAPLPCSVECPECGERQSIGLVQLRVRQGRPPARGRRAEPTA